MDWEPLIAWFEEEKRSFPWRDDPSPYRVWISEVMLQQTRASVVVPYFERWMVLFPTIGALAAAPLEQVMKAWEGLGYYSRARHLHETAQVVLREYDGILPGNREKLARLKGFGPYTVGAVLSFAFRQKAAAVDGNVVRVVSRLLALHDMSGVEVEKMLPEYRPWVVMEALIELGAVVCQKKPECDRCPLHDQCQGYLRGIAEGLPLRLPKKPATLLERDVAVIVTDRHLLLRHEEVGKVMGGLFEFPYVERGEPWPFDLSLTKICNLPRVKHTFTRYRATLYPVLWKAEEEKEIKEYNWVPFDQIEKLPFSSGHRRVLNEYFTHRELGQLGRPGDAHLERSRRDAASRT